jgi:hypothetical protein
MSMTTNIVGITRVRGMHIMSKNLSVFMRRRRGP